MSNWAQGNALDEKLLVERIEMLKDLVKGIKHDLSSRVLALPVDNIEKHRMAIVAAAALVADMPERTRKAFDLTLAALDAQEESR